MMNRTTVEMAKDAAQATRGALALLDVIPDGRSLADVQRRAAMAALRRAIVELDVYILRLPA